MTDGLLSLKLIKFSISLLLLFLAGCENNLEKVNLLTNSGNLPVESGKNIEVIYSDSAKIKMKLFGPQMYKYVGKKTYLELPKGAQVEFYDVNMVVKSKISCNYAIKYQDEGKVVMKQNVLVVNEKGEQLYTEYLVWDSQKQIIYTDKFVKITTGQEVIYGDGLRSNEKFTKYKITKPQGVINIKDNE